MITLLVILWWVVGSASFIYWWTSEYDLTLYGGAGSVVVGFIGAFAFLMGWLIHGKSNAAPSVLIKARK